MVLFRLTLFTLMLIWSIGILYPMFPAENHDKFIEFLLAAVYSTVCHQQAEKCISIDGSRMLVCARCAGIYSGALFIALTAILLKKLRINNTILFTALTVLCADVLSVFIGIYDYSKIIAFTTGMFFGISIYLYLLIELENFLLNSMNEIIK
jgi:uncharacterized membrane protein